MDLPKIIVFTKLLHKPRNPSHQEIKDYLSKNADDVIFTKRAETLIECWKLKEHYTDEE
jgi:hypothetical protein